MLIIICLHKIIYAFFIYYSKVLSNIVTLNIFFLQCINKDQVGWLKLGPGYPWVFSSAEKLWRWNHAFSGWLSSLMPMHDSFFPPPPSLNTCCLSINVYFSFYFFQLAHSLLPYFGGTIWFGGGRCSQN
jgi:hypothetical protein